MLKSLNCQLKRERREDRENESTIPPPPHRPPLPLRNLRPCKTLFVSSYSFSLRRLPSSSSSSGFVTIVTEINQILPETPFLSFSLSFLLCTLSSLSKPSHHSHSFSRDYPSTRHPHHRSVDGITIKTSSFSLFLLSLQDRRNPETSGEFSSFSPVR